MLVYQRVFNGMLMGISWDTMHFMENNMMGRWITWEFLMDIYNQQITMIQWYIAKHMGKKL